MLFDSWDSIARTVIFGGTAYVFAIALLRLTGSRTLSKMNAFDLVVTIAFGSTLSAILVSESLSLATGIAALSVLVGLQFVVAALAVRSDRFRKLVTAQPVLLAWDGRSLDRAMREERVTLDDLHFALRRRGLARLDQAQGLVLEADGSVSVIEKSKNDDAQILPGLAPPQD